MTKGICPVCNGTGVVDDHKCRNCGGQYMYGSATGQVNIDKDGSPCVHQYQGKTIGRCLTEYTCVRCSDRHVIDSGD